MNLLLKMKRIKDLSPSERQVVNFIMNDPARAANMGIVEIAQKTYTSTSTVMRVSKKLDMESFIDFRLQLAADMNEYLESSVVFKSQAPIERHDSLDAIVDKVCSNNARAVLDTKKLNDLSTMQKVVDMMSTAKQFDFFGNGVSNLICQDALMKALRLGVQATAYSYYAEMAILSKTCDASHLAFLISYTGWTNDTLDIAVKLKQAGIPSVSITSHTDNPLLELCSVNLFVDSYESVYRVGGMSSRISTLNVLDVLFAAYINANCDTLTDTINKTFVKETFSRRWNESGDKF
ncbi:MurR/RpiR family transcriptional regulator [Oscillospiraceae bacterium PP1C4]